MKTIFELYQANQNFPAYLLLDAAQNYKNFRRGFFDTEAQVINLFSDTVDKDTPIYLSPVLVHLTDYNVTNISSVIEQWSENHLMANVLFGLQAKDEIIRHLQQYLTVVMPDGVEVLFRFYDPTVAKQLPVLLDTDNYAEFMQPFESWWIIDSDGLFKSLPTPQNKEKQ